MRGNGLCKRGEASLKLSFIIYSLLIGIMPASVGGCFSPIDLSPTEQQLTNCLLKIMRAEDEQEYEEPHLDGLHFMLNQPEFAHSHRILALMELVEHRNLLRTILPHQLGSHGVQVVIGKENKAEVIHNYSVVISQYGLPEEAVGTIGVVGPTRMPYARTISTVGYLASVLSGLVAELYGRETPAHRGGHDAN